MAVSGGNLLARWRHDLREGSDIQVQAYYDRTYALAPHYQETRNTFDLDFIHHLTLGEHHNFIWGVGARLSPSEFVQTVPTLDLIPHDFANNVYSGFVQDEIAIVPNKFSLTVGSKLEHNNLHRIRVPAQHTRVVDDHAAADVLGGGHTRRPHSLPHRGRLSSH